FPPLRQGPGSLTQTASAVKLSCRGLCEAPCSTASSSTCSQALGLTASISAASICASSTYSHMPSVQSRNASPASTCHGGAETLTCRSSSPTPSAESSSL